MQKINIKKVTKEQMLKMLEEAAEKQEAAEAEAAAHFKDGVKLAEENEKLRGEIGALTEKLEENEKALEEVTAKYKSADHSAAMLRSRIDEAETNAKRKEELLCGALHTIKTERSIKEDYHESLKWCMAHPWRNLWAWFKREAARHE